MKRLQFGLVCCVLLSPFFLSGCSVQQKPDNKGGVYRSMDGGSAFEQKVKINEDSSLANSTVMAMTFDPHDSNIIFVGTPNGIFRTKNGGDDWESLKTGFKNVSDIVIHPHDSNIIYVPAVVAGTGKIMKTTDGGENWKELYTQRTTEGSVYSVELDYKNPEIVYAGNSGGTIFKSVDSGDTWEVLHWHKGGLREIEIDSINPQIVYFISSKSGFLRTNNGCDIVEVKSKGAVLSLVPHPYKENALYLSDDNGIHKSDNGGDDLENVRTLVRPEKIKSRGIAIDPRNDRTIYFISGQAVYKSVNGGKTWKPVQFSTPRTVTTILIDPENTDNLYLGTRKVQTQGRGIGGLKLFPF